MLITGTKILLGSLEPNLVGTFCGSNNSVFANVVSKVTIQNRTCKFQPIKENMTAKVHTTELWWEGNSHSNSNGRTQLVQIKPLI